MSSPHVLVLPFSAQGHINPLMDLSRCLAKHGFKITFVNTEFTHKCIMSAMADKGRSSLDDRIRLVSIPDGLGPMEDRTDFGKLCEAILSDMPSKLEELIQNINSSDANDRITCFLADANMGWALEVADKMGIKGAILWPAAATVFALELSIPRLIDKGIINSEGFPIKKQRIQLCPEMPSMDTDSFPWSFIGDLATQKIIFEYIVKCIQALNLADWWLCNTTYELEPAAFSLFPKLLPIGPLMASHHQIENPGAQFWPEDSTCLNWLDQQPARSVIYVAFGSITIFDRTQFDELASGLVLSNRPFLWVVRPGIINGLNHEYPNGFQDIKGKIVTWAPQQKVLSHPAIACFLSHCGWNSTMEGLSNGVPFLCWPYFCDQHFNKSYICDVWKVGMRFEQDENGIISREEIKKKVEQLLDDEDVRTRCLELKETAINNVTEGGGSSKNLNDFIEWLKTELEINGIASQLEQSR